MSYIHLIGWGKQQAKPASDFNVGDVMMWNYGCTSKVVGIANETAKTITFVTESNGEVFGNKGEQYARKFMKGRLIAFV